MRTFEILLSLADLLTFFALAVRLPIPVFRMRYWVPISLFIVIAQVLVEGARWQMIPAYVLVSLFFLIWLLKKIPTTAQPKERKRIARVAFGLAEGMALLGLAVSIALPIILPVFHFPVQADRMKSAL